MERSPVAAKIQKLCSVFPCILLFSLLTVACILLGLCFCVLFQTEMDKDDPILITIDANYNSTENVLLACIYPARNFPSSSSDIMCPFSTYYCPDTYQCYNISDAVPACQSQLLTCENETFCYEYINGLAFTADNLAKELDLTYKQGWAICFYILASCISAAILITLPLIIIFRNRITWIPILEENIRVAGRPNPKTQKFQN